jgi:hypothetical protein
VAFLPAEMSLLYTEAELTYRRSANKQLEEIVFGRAQ